MTPQIRTDQLITVQIYEGSTQRQPSWVLEKYVYRASGGGVRVDRVMFKGRLYRLKRDSLNDYYITIK